ncbi:PCMD domain-containing protein [Bacteroides helcogenes]|uniref:Lipoprotein n=1 Tax=Bacteroides helcogenes (strain ATCC 35417 / DSM 20613 / JCM 6297 / CCUG 15421 / P 36-108) TaxID=693979 RepID=E6SSD6_BACT6|nr:PCMD domain-containing protein [Bacteroides helcogenes]ADV45187.1 putative lipoprotein [Bacteroides helcogenes P 36-108]MDY5238748.1 PCMD domain-containing protein [Bacteroides helcogenes]
MNIKNFAYHLFCLLSVAACAIENDIPYPIVDGSIQAMEVEGQCDAEGNSSTQSTINKTNRTVILYVDDTVDLKKLRITKLTVNNNAALVLDSAVCNNHSKFPGMGFESLDNLPISSDTRVNFSDAVIFTLRTYQDYLWKVTVKQILNRNIVLENQIGKAVIDDINRNIVIYVAKSQPLDKIKVTGFNLGGAHGSVTPDPTASATFDFSEPCTFYVSHAWEETSHKWTVYVYQTEDGASASAEVFPRTTNATLSGNIQSGKTPVIEYKKASDNTWNTLASSAVNVNGTSYTASLSNLSPGTAYQYRVSVDGTAGSAQSFNTAPATALTDGDFDNWYQDGKLWNPWSSGGTSFWDTGNRGAITISDSNSVPTDETCTGTGQAALLESKYLVLKFAAGNIFTGSYLKTVGTNGVLSFGRPFTSFPSKLRIHYKYTSVTIDKAGDDDYAYLKGRPDSCHIYIALTDWNEPREIRTRPSERQLFEKSDPNIIAYAELIKGETVSSYQEVELPLEYRYTNRTPKYIVVVASASKYGDFFTGGVGSKLWIDNFELIYD